MSPVFFITTYYLNAQWALQVITMYCQDFKTITLAALSSWIATGHKRTLSSSKMHPMWWMNCFKFYLILIFKKSPSLTLVLINGKLLGILGTALDVNPLFNSRFYGIKIQINYFQSNLASQLRCAIHMKCIPYSENSAQKIK